MAKWFFKKTIRYPLFSCVTSLFHSSSPAHTHSTTASSSSSSSSSSSPLPISNALSYLDKNKKNI
jgi:hypothetical protein